MSEVTIVGNLDVAELVFYIFFAFFIGLIIYLRREDRREGYPLEEDVGGNLLYNEGPMQRGSHKAFRLPFGHGTIVPEARDRDPIQVANARREGWPGSPLDPVGDPLHSGIGPAAFAPRANRPDIDMHGNPRIVPIGSAAGFFLSPRDPNLSGWPVLGADHVEAGRVSDIWVDTADHLIRYLSVSLSGGDPGRTAVVPFAMCSVHRGHGHVVCDALLAAQFAAAPTPATPGQISLYEEERIVGYFGGGYLYATPSRAEPLL